MVRPKLIKVAKIGAPFGIQGWLKLYLLLEDSKLFNTFTDFYIQYPRGSWQPAPRFCLGQKGTLTLIQFQGVTQREQAGRQFTHAELGVLREALPTLPKDEFYWEDLIGLTVKNQTGQVLGRVKALFATGANDVLVIHNDSKEELLIPYVFNHFVRKVDLTNDTLWVDWEV